MKGHVKLGKLPNGKWSSYRFDGDSCTFYSGPEYDTLLDATVTAALTAAQHGVKVLMEVQVCDLCHEPKAVTDVRRITGGGQEPMRVCNGCWTGPTAARDDGTWTITNGAC